MDGHTIVLRGFVILLPVMLWLAIDRDAIKIIMRSWKCLTASDNLYENASMEKITMQEVEVFVKAERARVCKLIEEELFDMSEIKRGYVSMPITRLRHWQEIKDGVD